MSKILTTLIVGMFAASAFAADVPATSTKPTAEAPATTKAVKKAHQAHNKTPAKSKADNGMSSAASATAVPASK